MAEPESRQQGIDELELVKTKGESKEEKSAATWDLMVFEGKGKYV